MIFVGAVLVFVLAIALPRLYLMWLHARVNSPQILFMQLCKAHELERDSILLLQELAVCRQLVNPSQLFVDPRYFQPNGLSDTLSQRHQDLISLQQLLFSTAV